MTRNFKIDNLKAMLIFLVVFGHLLECFYGNIQLWLYSVIYSFHMPAFVYTTGYFSRFDSKRYINALLYPYCIYQILYLLFQRFYLKEDNVLQFTTPYWLLWYLLSTMFWMLFLQFIEGKKLHSKAILIVSFLCALFIGYDNSIGYYLSLSRTIVLFPFYIAGYFRIFDHVEKMNKIRKTLCVGGIIFSSAAIWYFRNDIQNNWFYHALPYQKNVSSGFIRFMMLVLSFLWIAFLFLIVPSKEVKIISKLGKNTISIFLLHGFIIKIIDKTAFFHWNEIGNIIAALFLSIILCLILGSNITVKIFRITFNADRIKNFFS